MTILKRSSKVNLLVLALLLTAGCRSASRVITISSATDLASIQNTRPFDDLRGDYALMHELNFGQDPDEAIKSIRLSREDINYEVPERKIIFEVILWDLPLIKAFLAKKRVYSNSSVGEELRQRLLDEHRRYTKLSVMVDSHVHHYFNWKDWSIWIEDRFGRTYFPVKRQESDEEEIMLAEKKTVLGKETFMPEHMVYHHRGVLFFDRLDLPPLSPLKVIIANKDNENRVEMIFRVKGKSPLFVDEPFSELKEEPVPAPDVPEKKELDEVEKKQKMKEHFNLATQLFREEKFKEAIGEWENVLELDPTHALSKTKIEKAKQFLPDEEIELQVSDSQKSRQKQIHFLMGTEFYKSQEYELAIEEWKKVLEIDPDHALSKEKIEKAQEKLTAGAKP